MKCASLNQSDVFILDDDQEMYVWVGPKSSRMERVKVSKLAFIQFNIYLYTFVLYNIFNQEKIIEINIWYDYRELRWPDKSEMMKKLAEPG